MPDETPFDQTLLTQTPFDHGTRFARPRIYRAITREDDGRIVAVREISARSDAEAIAIARKPRGPHPVELWGECGLVLRFRGRDG